MKAIRPTFIKGYRLAIALFNHEKLVLNYKYNSSI